MGIDRNGGGVQAPAPAPVPATRGKETESETETMSSSEAAENISASNFRYSGKRTAVRLDSMKVMKPEQGWICEAEPANETQGPLIRSSLKPKGMTDATYKGCSSLYEIFERSCSKYPNNPLLGERLKNEDGSVSDYKWMTYREVKEKVVALGSGLLSEGLSPQECIGVFGANSPEWMIAMQACNRINARCVPLYDTLGENAVEFISNHAECKAVFVSGQKLGNLLKSKDNMATVKLIVYWGDVSSENKKVLSGMKIKTVAFLDLLSSGGKSPKDSKPAAPSDIATIMYTSGTTGNPKGVILQHSALVAELSAVGEKLAAVACDITENIFKLSQGEYVAVEVLESAYKKNLSIEQIWVYGNSFENCLVAIVVPGEEKLLAWAKEKGIAGDYAAVCKTPEANAMLLDELKKTGKAAKLKGFEIVKAIHLDSVQFSVETDLLTPTFKLKRPQLLKHYQSKVDALYAGLKK